MRATSEAPEPRTALVTGAGRGIGFAIARSLAEAGHRVALGDVDGDAVDAAARELAAAGLTVAGVRLDVTSTAVVGEVAREVARTLGPIDVLVNNAGVLHVGRLVDTPESDWQRVLDVNLTGAFRCAQAVLPGMIERRWGRVISLASITPLRGEARTAAYAASKGGIIGLTKSLSREIAHLGITVNAIAPGYILTDQTREVFAGEVGDAVKAQITMRRFGEVTDIAGVATFLASDAAGYLTGQVVVVDGGVV